jgi:hypothetical protein
MVITVVTIVRIKSRGMPNVYYGTFVAIWTLLWKIA